MLESKIVYKRKLLGTKLVVSVNSKFLKGDGVMLLTEKEPVRVKESIREECLELEFEYGMGGSMKLCESIDAVVGRRIRELLQKAVESQQNHVAAWRTAETLCRNVLENRRLVDVEVTSHPRNGVPHSTPAELDDVLIPNNEEDAQLPEKVTIHVSEPYKGGK
jgi:hypothetical protein